MIHHGKLALGGICASRHQYSQQHNPPYTKLPGQTLLLLERRYPQARNTRTEGTVIRHDNSALPPVRTLTLARFKMIVGKEAAL
jgi:hypothetical protein